DSPYQPLSTFAGNELLIDIGELIELGLIQPREAEPLTRLARDTVDYGNLIPLKNQILKLAASRFEQNASAELKAACDDFVETHDQRWLHDYALFRILKSKHGEKSWPEWDAKFVHRDHATLKDFESSADAELAHVKVIQFLFHHQWQALRRYANDKGVRLFGDMPIGIALDSADAWAHPEILQIDRDGKPSFVAGVPPDYFSETGQLWGNPLYAWDAHAADNYRWWAERVSTAAQLADMVRIDHFRGFEAYWSVPATSKTADVGSWIQGPGDAIFDAMRHSLGYLPLVAEDLGVITPEVEALRDRHQIPGMVVLQLDIVNPEFELDKIVENCVCYTGTHDNDTTVGWFHGGPEDIRSQGEVEMTRDAALALTGGSAETIHSDLVRVAFSTNAKLAIAPMQDFLGLGSDARLNTPGTSSNNWRWRLRSSQLDTNTTKSIATMVSESNRGLS
ncbi:MAG: 4-alpha-glucanotransferase, partial [Pseudomonadota bacterium]